MTLSLLQDIEEPKESLEEHRLIERRILKHAMRSFGRRGYAATSLRGIAADAEVTAPLVSYYFKSKEGLYLRIGQIVLGTLEAEVKRVLEPELGFSEAITAIVRAHVAIVDCAPSALEFMLAMLYGPQEGQPAPDIEGLYAGTQSLIRRTFERGIETGEFRPRPGTSVDFLVERLSSLIHDDVIRRFRAERLIERHPERKAEVEQRLATFSFEVALDHFFFGAGEVTDAPRQSTKTSTS